MDNDASSFSVPKRPSRLAAPGAKGRQLIEEQPFGSRFLGDNILAFSGRPSPGGPLAPRWLEAIAQKPVTSEAWSW
ncbi:MAG: hypothetical protein AB1896_07725 [Thermodesulfobacteriota bacterium]